MGIFEDAARFLESNVRAVTSINPLLGEAVERGENLITEGVFETTESITGKRRKERILANSERNKVLFNEIIQDQTISEITRGELLNRFDTLGVLDDGAFGSLSTTFSQAKEGIAPKFRARQATEEFLAITRDRPGQRQTRFVDSAGNLGV